jgi:hypothetical protein
VGLAGVGSMRTRGLEGSMRGRERSWVGLELREGRDDGDRRERRSRQSVSPEVDAGRAGVSAAQNEPSGDLSVSSSASSSITVVPAASRDTLVGKAPSILTGTHPAPHTCSHRTIE